MLHFMLQHLVQHKERRPGKVRSGFPSGRATIKEFMLQPKAAA